MHITVNVLLEAGTNVNASAQNGYTALMGAACEGKKDCVERLLEAGADATAEFEGCTAMEHAYARQHYSISHILS